MNSRSPLSALAFPLSLMLVLFALPGFPALADEPFKLNVEQKNYQQGDSGYEYPAPQMVQPTQPIRGRAIHTQPHTTPPPQQPHAAAKPPVLNGGVQASVSLPPAFLGVWNVQGQRTKVEAMPEFQEGAERAFAMNNTQIWTINGNPEAGYTLGSNTGVQTPLVVDKVQGTTAFIRYQHPVGNTVAQEAVVMSLIQGGAQFNGLERVSIVKQGLPQPRAKVTYQLVGQRQR
jgi:hypothetical protein